MSAKVDREMIGRARHFCESDVDALCSLASAVLDGREALEQGATAIQQFHADNPMDIECRCTGYITDICRILDHVEDEP